MVHTDPLYPLIYPFVQVTLSTISLLPTLQYIPLRLQLCAMLITIIQSCHVYIPLLPHLINMFSTLTNDNIKTIKSTTQVINLHCILRVNKSITKHVTYHIAALQHILGCIELYCTTLSYSISYTELVIPLLYHMKHYTKKSKHIVIKKKVQQLIQHIQANSIWCELHRNNHTLVNYSPVDMLKQNMDVLYTFKYDTNNNDDRKKVELSPLELIHNSTANTVQPSTINAKQIDWTGNGSSRSNKPPPPPRDEHESSDEEHHEAEGYENNNDDDGSELDSDVDTIQPTKQSNDKPPQSGKKKQPRAVYSDDDAEDVVHEMTISDVDD